MLPFTTLSRFAGISPAHQAIKLGLSLLSRTQISVVCAAVTASGTCIHCGLCTFWPLLAKFLAFSQTGGQPFQTIRQTASGGAAKRPTTEIVVPALFAAMWWPVATPAMYSGLPKEHSPGYLPAVTALFSVSADRLCVSSISHAAPQFLPLCRSFRTPGPHSSSPISGFRLWWPVGYPSVRSPILRLLALPPQFLP